MTTRNKSKRLKKLEQTLRTRPIKPDVVKAAHDRFRQTGELPEDQNVAAQVVELVKMGLDSEMWMACNGDEKALIRAYVGTPPRPKDEVMDALLGEAVWAPEPLQRVARHVLKGLAETGLDVTQPLFAGRNVKLPDYGSAGLHLLGMPECLAMPPYEEQAHRLFQRFAELRKQINQDDKRWFETLDDAVGMFREYGELSEDQLLRDAVLACEEFQCLLRHASGECDAEMLAAFDAAAMATGQEREAALEAAKLYLRSRTSEYGAKAPPVPSDIARQIREFVSQAMKSQEGVDDPKAIVNFDEVEPDLVDNGKDDNES